MNKLIFPVEFLWGASTSDSQIEGAIDKDGRGETFWDRFSSIPGRIYNNDNAYTACDHYHRYEKDITLMKEIGLKAYRFSISWTRIFPEGKGKPNSQGMDFYKRLTNLLVEKGIKPIITLQHWSFPQKLQDIGGWANREVTDYFSQYANYVFGELGDLVSTWITHNEPLGTSHLGYFTGEHAPGLRDFSTSLQVIYNLLLSHGKTVRAYRQTGQKGEIGITLNFHPSYPLSEKEEDIEATARMHKYFNSLFPDAIFKGQFPGELEKFFAQKGVRLPEISSDDFKLISEPIDFLGVNYYYPHFIKYNPFNWPFEADYTPARKEKPKTSAGWEIFPKGLYTSIKGLIEDYGNIKMYITENGASFDDIIDVEERVEDPQRIDFFQRHIEQIHKCIEEDIKVSGYFIWSLMDNFEWSCGYSKRFGIVYVDFNTLARIIKSSGYWYKKVIANNGLI